MRTICSPVVVGLSGLFLLACDGSGPLDAASAKEEPAPATASADRAKSAPIASKDSAPAFGDGAKAEESRAAPDGKLAPLDSPVEGVKSDDKRDDSMRQQPAPTAGQLTAGQWSDRDDWSRWQGLLAAGSQYHQVLDSWRIPHRERVAVTVRGHEFVPADTTVLLKNEAGSTVWQARTDNEGRADLFLWPGQSGRLEVRGPQGTLASRNVQAGEEHQLRVDHDVPVASALDLMFVVDTTGSMSDELSYLQAELSSIVQRVQRSSAQRFDVRTSVNFFRDQGDEYRLRSFPFTADTLHSISRLRAQSTGGGGDYPEALAAALEDGVERHQWSDSAVARIMFVVTDAPPHPGSMVGRRIERTVAQAATKGIRIVPIASSGIDKPAEFLLRHLAVRTGGTYVFLTDHSGIGNAHIEPTVGPHVIEPLDDLLVELIEDYASPERLSLVAPAKVNERAPRAHAPVAYVHARNDGPSPWWLLGLGLLVPGFVAGRRWTRLPVVPPITDPRVARARRMLGELDRSPGSPAAETESWRAEIGEVVDGMEQLVRKRDAISTSLRVAGALPEEAGSDGVRSSLRTEVERRRAAIEAEIDAGLVSVEAAYLHLISGVGESSTTQASLDAAREALQTRIDVDRELRS